MCVDCVLASPRIAQVDPGDEPLPEVVLSQCCRMKSAFYERKQYYNGGEQRAREVHVVKGGNGSRTPYLKGGRPFIDRAAVG
jgi:hypothetical protein